MSHMPTALTGREPGKELPAQKPCLEVIHVGGRRLDSEGTAVRVRVAKTFPRKPLQIAPEVLDGAR